MLAKLTLGPENHFSGAKYLSQNGYGFIVASCSVVVIWIVVLIPLLMPVAQWLLYGSYALGHVFMLIPCVSVSKTTFKA